MVISDAEWQQMMTPDRTRTCLNCHQTPVVPVSGLCGPCHFGQAAAVNGGWWDATTQDLSGKVTLY
jgi:hypothetical protein